jgi:hypothetical protein
MSTTDDTLGDHDQHDHHELRREPTKEEKTREAIDEGHDADIPSNIGFVLTEVEERKRRASIAKRNSLDKHHHVKDETAETTTGVHDDEEDDVEESESDVVWWDGEKDPQNPYNWARWRKVLNCVLVSALTFVTPLASCKSLYCCFVNISLIYTHISDLQTTAMFAPGVPALMVEFKSNSSELASFCVSVYVLGFAAGPMIFAPLSELYGRLIVYHGCNIGFIGEHFFPKHFT